MKERRRADNPFRDERIMRIREALKERNEVKVGTWFLVRIPRAEGKIFLRKSGKDRTYVELIYDQRYDPETKQNRNRRVSIGQVLDLIPEAMIPNEKYYAFFDRETGVLLGTPKDAAGAKGSLPAPAEGGDDTDRQLAAAIENALERGNRILAADEKLRGQVHEAPTEEPGYRGTCKSWTVGPDSRTDGGTTAGIYGNKRIRILLDILNSIREVIRDQARTRPEAVVNRFQAEKINAVLQEIQALEKGRGLGDLLELIWEPKEMINADGETTVTGMNYSDAEVLLEYYNSVVWNTQGELEKS